MKLKRIAAAFASAVLSACMVIQAGAENELALKGIVNKFDLGSDAVGGSGVEEDDDTSRNWVKVIQPFNEFGLFTEPEEPDIAAVAVTFEISDWSGKEFNVGWGGLITFFDGSGNWFGYDDFKGISDYVINSEGEYTVVCDLGALCIKNGQPDGIDYLQALEMVIDGVEAGDPTVIEVKSARVYFAGEAVESAKLPDGTEIPIETAALNIEEESSADQSSEAESQTSESTAESAAEEISSQEDSSSVSDTSSTAQAETESDEEKSDNGNMLLFGGIAAAVVVILAIVIIIRRKK